MDQLGQRRRRIELAITRVRTTSTCGALGLFEEMEEGWMEEGRNKTHLLALKTISH